MVKNTITSNPIGISNETVELVFLFKPMLMLHSCGHGFVVVGLKKMRTYTALNDGSYKWTEEGIK